MSRWDPRNGFEGTLIQLLEDIDRRFVPEPAVVEAAQEWLCRELDEARGPFPCRHFSSRNGFKIGPKLRYFDRHEHALPFDVIASDNECSSSLFAALRAGTSLRGISMLEALQRGVIKTGILTREMKADPSARRFAERGIRTTMNDHPMRIALGGLTLCHLADAADQVSDLDWASPEEELRARIFRSLSPLNVFPFPHPSSRTNGYVQRLGKGRDTDLGGTAAIQHFIANFLIRKFFDRPGDAVPLWFARARYAPPIMTEAEFTSFGAQELLVEPVEAHVALSALPAEACDQTTASGRERTVAAQRVDEVLLVREERLRELQARIRRNPRDLLTKNADFETSSRNYFFVIEKPGKYPDRVRACLAMTSGGVLELRDCTRSGKRDAEQYDTEIPGCYVMARGPGTRTNRDNWYRY